MKKIQLYDKLDILFYNDGIQIFMATEFTNRRFLGVLIDSGGKDNTYLIMEPDIIAFNEFLASKRDLLSLMMGSSMHQATINTDKKHFCLHTTYKKINKKLLPEKGQTKWN